MTRPPSKFAAAVETKPETLETFIARWSAGEGGQERANYALFLSELCEVLDVPRPDQASYDAALNAYAFERAVTFRGPDGSTARGRIDLYRRGSFVLEAKQSRCPGTAKAEQSSLFDPEPQESGPLGRRTTSRAWDVLMLNARQQAEEYAKALPAAEGWPPFLIVCDVGNCFEIYADFTGQGKNYAQFPDRQGFRIYLEDLRQENIRERLRLIWIEPHKLDPAKIAAKATRLRIKKHRRSVRDPPIKNYYIKTDLMALRACCMLREGHIFQSRSNSFRGRRMTRTMMPRSSRCSMTSPKVGSSSA
jgi:hypothetical protein